MRGEESNKTLSLSPHSPRLVRWERRKAQREVRMGDITAVIAEE